MEKQMSMFQTTPHWVILIDKKDEEDLKKSGFEVLLSRENLYNPDYSIVEIEAIGDEPTSADEILVLTGAIAVHEEYTTGIVLEEENLDEIADDIYAWQGAGDEFMSDMLTQIEKLSILLTSLHEKSASSISIDDIGIVKDKDSKPIPLAENVDSLFLDDLYGVEINGVVYTIWWANMITGKGYNVIIIQDEEGPLDDDEDEDDTPMYPLSDRAKAENEYMKDYYRELWGDYYEYDY